MNLRDEGFGLAKHPEVAYDLLPDDQSGVYAWTVTTDALDSLVPENLPRIPSGSVVYIGKANKLRKRAPHHRWTSSSSSLRRNLAGIMGLQGLWLPRASKPRLVQEHEMALSLWMRSNLALSWRAVDEGYVQFEKLLLSKLTPPLNVDPPETELQWWVYGQLQKLKDEALPPHQ
ncbi:hypothetical protein DBR22_04380 [Arthrobacter sp. HMWF013]|nr:hypothetical protein DBR22_04380 [Arthrobacter sp. HMWF013]